MRIHDYYFFSFFSLKNFNFPQCKSSTFMVNTSRLRVLFCLVILFHLTLSAQRGKDGVKIISTPNNFVNEYTNLTASVGAGTTTIPVTASALNANGRFTGPLAPGDLIMIYQVQGVFINGYASGTIGLPNDTTWGRVADYYNTGRYEFAQVKSVPSSTSITLDCGLKNNYDVNATFFYTLVVRVPRYTSLTINTGGVLTCDDWNGISGGVLAVEVEGNTVVNAGGFIDATGKGFRGGTAANNNTNTFGVNNVASTNANYGGEKGESVTGYQADYDLWGGRHGRGAAANGGGGGCAHNAGGGGGANAAQNIYNWKGYGIPDLTGANYNVAWNLDNAIISTLNNTNSAGGGRGGYTFSNSNQNAILVGPSNTNWGGDNRNRDATGLGGRPLDYSTGRLFFGGGGGAGDQNNSSGGNGGDGGGLVYLMVYGNISGSGTVQSNGNNGASTSGGTQLPTGMDAASGAGAGGVVVLNSVGGVANTLICNTNGGNGGNQVIGQTNGSEAEGPGGGGGGGYIAVSSGTPTRNSNGGNNGTTNSGALTEFLPNGALRGCAGINNGTISFFTINASNVSVCTGSSATLTASLGGNPPAGTTLIWYDAAVAGNQLGTGTTYTTPALTSTTTYYVGSCPGTYRVPVTVTINPLPIVTINATTPACVGAAAFNLTATPTGGTWSGTGITNSANGTFNPTTAGTGTFTITYTFTDANNCTNSDTEQQIVTTTGTASITPVSPVCANTAAFNFTASPAGGTWSGTGITNSSNGTFNPATAGPGTFTVTYSVTGSCASTDQETITVNSVPSTSISPVSPVCSNASAFNLTAATSGGVWSGTGITNTTTGTFSPTTSGAGSFVVTYSISGTCPSSSTQTITVNSTPNTSINAVSPVCSNASAFNLTAATGGGIWSGTGITNTTAGIFSPTTSGAGSFVVTYSIGGTCPSSSTQTITVNSTPNTSINVVSPVCSNASAFNLTAATGGGIWSGTGITNTTAGVFSPTTSGAGSFVVTYSIGGTCPSSSTQTITVNSAPVVTVSSQTICPGASATVTATGATSYSWSSGGTNSSIVVSPATTTSYTVTGTDNGCQSTAVSTVMVISPTPPVINAVSPICANSNVFNLTVNVPGGSWSGSGITDPLNGTFSPAVAGSGTITVTYTIPGSCGGSDNENIVVLPVPSITVSTNSPLCAGNSIQLSANTISGAVYAWVGPGNFSSSQEDPSIPNSITSSSGNYTLTITSNGCSSTDSTIVLVNPVPVSNAGSDAFICQGSSVTLSGAGSGSFSWSPVSGLSSSVIASPVATPDSTTIYVLTVTANGCSSSDSVLISIAPTPVLSLSNDTSICVGDCVTLNVSGADFYSWSPGTGLADSTAASQQICPPVSVTYTVTGYLVGSNIVANGDFGAGNTGFTSDYTLNSNTQQEGTYFVTSNANFTHPNFVGVDHTTGTGNFLIVNGSGVANSSVWCQTISIQPNTDYIFSSWVSTLAPGSPALLQFSINGVQVGNVFQAPANTGTWIQFYTPWNSGSNTTAVICIVNQNTTLGGNDFGIDDIFFSPVCPSVKTVTINVNNQLDPTISSVSPVCDGSPSFQLSAASSGGVWSGTGVSPSGTFDPVLSGAGNFVVTYSLSGSCGGVDTAQVLVVPNDSVVISSVSVICFTSPAVTLSATPAGGTWNGTGIANPSGVFDPASSGLGNFMLYYASSGLCPDTDSVSVTVVPTFDATINPVAPLCSDALPFTLNAVDNGGVWSGAGIQNAQSGLFDPQLSGAGTFVITYSISGTCGSSDTVQIVVNPAADATIATNNANLCANSGVLNLTSLQTGGVWSGTGVTNTTTGVFDPLQSGVGTFPVVYTISGACGDADTISVTVSPVPNPAIVTPSLSGCAPFCTNFSNNGGNDWFWSFGDGVVDSTQNPSHCFTISGTYTVQLFVSNGFCSDTSSIVVTVDAQPTADFSISPSATVSPGTNVSFSNTSQNALGYWWNFGDPIVQGDTSSFTNTAYTYADTGSYCITLISYSSTQCADTVTKCLLVIDDAFIEVPNIFTPNGDGLNETFFFTTKGIRDLKCVIFDRWGIKVSEFSGVNGSWDGSIEGNKKASSGTYYFVVDYSAINGDTGNEEGYLQLIAE
jgi:gliding motility-associated-like protein